MNAALKVGEHIVRLSTPYKDIFTTVCLIKTAQGCVLFDAASYDEDISAHILPFLAQQRALESLRAVFISHPHADHAGGLSALLKAIPDLTVVSDSLSLREKYPEANFAAAKGNLLGVLKIIPLPGHTIDSAAILDTRTGTLLSGDCLQMWGIFGSGKWGANIRYPAEHVRAVRALRSLPISEIVAAHDYHPCGWHITGEEAVSKALDDCVAPLRRIADLIAGNPLLDDEGVCALYNSPTLPVLGAHVVTAVRASVADASLSF